jgi:two-component system nitrate/nitrite response regulator NarL
MTRVLLADDHPMIASALEMLLRGTDYQLVGRARSGKEALAQIDEVNPDLVLLDVNMPDGTGIDVLRKLRRNGEKRPIVLLTAGLDDPQLIAADDLEPNGVVLKTSDPALLLECMDQVLNGKTWVDPEIVDRTKAAKQRVSSLPPLTPRERELVELVRQGLRNRDIAQRLGVTEGTVKVYLHSIFDKVGVGSRTELAIRASGLIGS